MNAIVAASTQNMSRVAWLDFRKNGIGGSDVAAACGLSKWKSPMALWLEKTGQIEPEAPGEAAYWGTVMEPIIREEFSSRNGMKVRQIHAILQHRRFSFMFANLDGLVTDPDRGEGIFEAKTAGAYASAEWENGLPDEYALQVQHYLAVTGLQFAYVAALIGGNRFIWRYIERDQVLIDMMIQLESRFWHLVESNTPPSLDGSNASTDLLNRLYPKGKAEQITLPDETLALITSFEIAQAEELAAGERKNQMINQLKALLGESETGVCSTRLVSWKNIRSERLDSKALKADHPDLFAQYTKTSEFRRFSIK